MPLTIYPVCIRWPRWLSRRTTDATRELLPSLDWHELSTTPGGVGLERVPGDWRKFLPLHKDENSAFMVFGGGGTAKLVEHLASEFGLRLIFFESTHDYPKEIIPNTRFGYQTAIDSVLPKALEYHESSNCSKVLVVPGRDTSGLAHHLAKRLEAKGVKVSCSYSARDLIPELHQNNLVIVPEFLCFDFGADPNKSISTYPLEEKLRKMGFIESEHKYLRLKGKDIEALERADSEHNNAVVRHAAKLSKQVLEVIAEDRNCLESLAGLPVGKHCERFGNCGLVCSLGEVSAEMARKGIGTS